MGNIFHFVVLCGFLSISSADLLGDSTDSIFGSIDKDVLPMAFLGIVLLSFYLSVVFFSFFISNRFEWRSKNRHSCDYQYKSHTDVSGGQGGFCYSHRPCLHFKQYRVLVSLLWAYSSRSIQSTCIIHSKKEINKISCLVFQRKVRASCQSFQGISMATVTMTLLLWLSRRSTSRLLFFGRLRYPTSNRLLLTSFRALQAMA